MIGEGVLAFGDFPLTMETSTETSFLDFFRDSQGQFRNLWQLRLHSIRLFLPLKGLERVMIIMQCRACDCPSPWRGAWTANDKGGDFPLWGFSPYLLLFCQVICLHLLQGD